MQLAIMAADVELSLGCSVMNFILQYSNDCCVFARSKAAKKSRVQHNGRDIRSHNLLDHRNVRANY